MGRVETMKPKVSDRKASLSISLNTTSAASVLTMFLKTAGDDEASALVSLKAGFIDFPKKTVVGEQLECLMVESATLLVRQLSSLGDGFVGKPF